MIAFLHTAAGHVETFARLTAELDDTIPVRHEVRESLLTEAITAGGVTEADQANTAAVVHALARDGARLIVCTCSTLGGVAEAVPVAVGTVVLRIDRPMVEQAVASGRRIMILGAVRSTFAPTVALLREVASDAQRTLDVIEVFCDTAWPLFEAGDHANYARKIAEIIELVAQPRDLVLLAQASMAPAAELVRHLGIPVLSSPRLGVAAAVARYRSL